MSIKCKKYNSKIKIYYIDELEQRLAEKIINDIWFTEELVPAGYELIKGDSPKSRVFKLSYQGEIYYIKSQAPRDWKKLIKNLFRPAAAVRNLKISSKLLEANISTARPIIGITWKKSLLIKDNIFITEELAGVNLYEYLKNNREINHNRRKEVIRQIAEIWGKLINNNLLHQDPSLENFIINFSEDNVEVSLIDTDNIYSVPFFLTKMVLNNLAKLRARQLSDFVKSDTLPLTGEEFDLFLEEFLKVYRKEFKLAELRERVNQLTVNRLVKYGSKEKALKDEQLNSYL